MKVRTGDYEIHVQQQGEGDPLFLVHGLGMSGALWRDQVGAFGAHFQTIAVDLRGFGESSRPHAPGAYAIEALAEDIAGVASALGHERIHLLGTSMGGFVGQALALAHPTLCRSLVLCQTGPRMSLPEDLLRARVEALRSLPLEEYADLVVDQATGPDARERLRPFIRELIARNDKRAYAQVLTEGLADFDVSDRVHTISAPTLVVVGELDRVIPPDEGRELAKRIPGAQLAEISGVGHLAYAERPEVFNEIVLDFLLAL